MASGSQTRRAVSALCPVRANHSASVRPRGTRPNRAARPEAQDVETRPPGQAEGQEPGQEVPGRGQVGTIERRPAPVVAIVDAQVILDQEQVRGPGAAQQVQRRFVARDHEVRAVVHVFARDGVREGGGAAAEEAAALEEGHLVPALLEGDGRGQSGETAADDDDPHRRAYTRASVRAATQSLRGVESGARGPGGKPRPDQLVEQRR